MFIIYFFVTKIVVIHIFRSHVQCRIVLKFNFHVFCFVVVICDLVHDVETVFILP